MAVIVFRNATRIDVPLLVKMLADDPLGLLRERYEDPLPESYLEAFEVIDADPNHELIVAEVDGDVAGFLQVSFLLNLTYQGRWRALIEGVRVNKKYRGEGVGRALFEQAIGRARARNCHVVQLTTDKKRPEALAFYEKLGFKASHEGMKMHLEKHGS